MANHEMNDGDKNRKNAWRKKGRKKYAAPVLVKLGTLALSKIAFCSITGDGGHGS